jgi:hypothetical protein
VYKTVQLDPPFVVYMIRWLDPRPSPPVTKQVDVLGQEMLPGPGVLLGVVKAVQLVPSAVVITAAPLALLPA